MYSLIRSAKLNGIDPKAYLLDVLTKLPTAKRGPRCADALEFHQ
ncbi:MAG: transposase domain-containing protein [Betaproteobacteria bacterium]|nr:transposase domain-containing protein [Betaproteobacteria bacterium]